MIKHPTLPKPTLPEVVDRFADYHRRNPSWGMLHSALDGGNVADGHILLDVKWAEYKGDAEAVMLTNLLLRMSRRQRLALGNWGWNGVRRRKRADKRRALEEQKPMHKELTWAEPAPPPRRTTVDNWWEQ